MVMMDDDGKQSEKENFLRHQFTQVTFTFPPLNGSESEEGLGLFSCLISFYVAATHSTGHFLTPSYSWRSWESDRSSSWGKKRSRRALTPSKWRGPCPLSPFSSFCVCLTVYLSVRLGSDRYSWVCVCVCVHIFIPLLPLFWWGCFHLLRSQIPLSCTRKQHLAFDSLFTTRQYNFI